MKISALIKHLQDVKKKHGDVDVIADDEFDERGWMIEPGRVIKTTEGPVLLLAIYQEEYEWDDE